MQVAFAFPAVAVIVAVPAFIPFTTPVLLTVATSVLLLVYFTVPAGVAVAFTVTVFPAYTVAVVLSNLTVPFFTVTVQVAVAFPQLAVIVAVPVFTPVTTPVLLTVATAVLPDTNVTAVSLSFAVAFSVTVLPVYTDAAVLSRATVTLTRSFSAN